MASNNAYDLCIVGAGLIGSAAAQHASKWGKVCLIGPEEPKVRTGLRLKYLHKRGESFLFFFFFANYIF